MSCIRQYFSRPCSRSRCLHPVLASKLIYMQLSPDLGLQLLAASPLLGWIEEHWSERLRILSRLFPVKHPNRHSLQSDTLRIHSSCFESLYVCNASEWAIYYSPRGTTVVTFLILSPNAECGPACVQFSGSRYRIHSVLWKATQLPYWSRESIHLVLAIPCRKSLLQTVRRAR
ncbi:hypothetical protein BS47DRAFT_237057 [Hydnum rufescens UP504]|uniref:Uncharacterized protein n=1 Tax=Hydnum rufescens UP504 TaxID=1448309 RepID=A0A9P6AM25_9AGAM|nr:hypothetical protein BS47DRAFT_237057 [Hydnum rufescens UP504]